MTKNKNFLGIEHKKKWEIQLKKAKGGSRNEKVHKNGKSKIVGIIDQAVD